jgi:cholesterol transport system auxiliary component
MKKAWSEVCFLRGWIAACVGVVMLGLSSGCSNLLHSKAPPIQAYLLRATAATNSAAPALNAPSLRIGRTLTAPGLDGDSIVLVNSEHRLDFFASSRWVAPIPQMIEDLAAETLRNSGAWSSVHDSQGAFPTEYFLQIDIRRFEADYTEGSSPKVHVVLNCTLGRRTDRELLSSFVAAASASADANRLSSVVAAFESATQTALAQIAERGKQALAANAAGPRQ